MSDKPKLLLVNAESAKRAAESVDESEVGRDDDPDNKWGAVVRALTPQSEDGDGEAVEVDHPAELSAVDKWSVWMTREDWERLRDFYKDPCAIEAVAKRLVEPSWGNRCKPEEAWEDAKDGEREDARLEASDHLRAAARALGIEVPE